MRDKLIDPRKHKEFQCMLQDAKVLLNMIEQSTRADTYVTDYLQPGLLSGQTKSSVIEEYAKSILNHLKNMDNKHEVFM